MRSEEAMLTLITTIAEQDERIRAVMMNGSRVNPAAKRDIFQDFDIVYFVTEIDSFLADHTWIDCFGERMIMQMPEAMADPPPMNDGHFTYLEVNQSVYAIRTHAKESLRAADQHCDPLCARPFG